MRYMDIIVSVDFSGILNLITGPKELCELVAEDCDDFNDIVIREIELDPGVYKCTLLRRDYPYSGDYTFDLLLESIESSEGLITFPVEEEEPKSFRIEGNNGGDYLELTVIDEDTSKLELGHCCVVLTRCRIPNEFLTGILGTLFMEESNPKKVFKKIVGNVWTNSRFMEEICSKIKILDFLDNEIEEKE